MNEYILKYEKAISNQQSAISLVLSELTADC